METVVFLHGPHLVSHTVTSSRESLSFIHLYCMFLGAHLEEQITFSHPISLGFFGLSQLKALFLLRLSANNLYEHEACLMLATQIYIFTLSFNV